MQMSEKKSRIFWDRVLVLGEDDCWEWQHGRFDTGYGAFYLNGQNRGAHRLSYEYSHGDINDSKLFVCHSCDNPPCVNPNHLFLGTSKVNVNDMHNKGRDVKYYAEREECSNGHKYELDSYFIRVRDGLESRVCRECDRQRGEKYRRNLGVKDINLIEGCSLGHKYDEDNLIPSGVKAGWKACLACNRAKSWIRNHEGYDIKYVSDLCYEFKLSPSKLIKKGLL